MDVIKNRDEDLIKRVNDLVSGDPSKWKEKALWRRENRYWTKYSVSIALQILQSDRYKSTDKEYLSSCLGLNIDDFNKYLKGTHNFTLKEIADIENVFEIKIKL